jgi:hypothetical protein
VKLAKGVRWSLLLALVGAGSGWFHYVLLAFGTVKVTCLLRLWVAVVGYQVREQDRLGHPLSGVR